MRVTQRVPPHRWFGGALQLSEDVSDEESSARGCTADLRPWSGEISIHGRQSTVQLPATAFGLPGVGAGVSQTPPTPVTVGGTTRRRPACRPTSETTLFLLSLSPLNFSLLLPFRAPQPHRCPCQSGLPRVLRSRQPGLGSPPRCAPLAGRPLFPAGPPARLGRADGSGAGGGGRREGLPCAAGRVPRFSCSRRPQDHAGERGSAWTVRASRGLPGARRAQGNGWVSPWCPRPRSHLQPGQSVPAAASAAPVTEAL